MTALGREMATKKTMTRHSGGGNKEGDGDGEGEGGGSRGEGTDGARLFPTVSLLSENTRVWCRFCEADIVTRSRCNIGAPPGTKVYCLDGSVLLEEHY